MTIKNNFDMSGNPVGKLLAPAGITAAVYKVICKLAPR